MGIYYLCAMIYRKDYVEQIERAFQAVPIVTLIGARQVGKTSIMQMYQYPGRTLTLNGQDPDTAVLFQHLADIELYLKVNLDKDIEGLVFLDEFQFIDNISTALKLLTDKYHNLKFLCSGSSSLDILQQVKESLAGRVRIIEVLSLSFSEYLLFTDSKLYDTWLLLDQNTKHSALTTEISKKLDEYLLYGGFPRAALIPNIDDKTEVLNDIYSTYLLKDVKSYIANADFIGFNKLLRLLSSQIGNLININELSLNSGLPYRKTEEYLELLEQMYIIKRIEPFKKNTRKSITKMKKVFFTDVGLRNIIERNFNEITFRADRGALFENYVLLELWRKKKSATEINFFRTTNGTEVDFVMNTLNELLAIECKYKEFAKPVSIKALDVFAENENISKKFFVNKTLNANHNETKIIQGYLVSKIV
jgi:predicted AAA+ superfamily ATPase